MLFLELHIYISEAPFIAVWMFVYVRSRDVLFENYRKESDFSFSKYFKK